MGRPDDAVPGSRVAGADPPVRVLICDDHEVLRQGLRTILRRVAGLDVVAEAACVSEALTQAATVRPDVTLVGLDGHGPVLQDLVRQVTGMGIRVVLFGDAGAGSGLVDVLRAGARGYVHTTASPQRLVDCLRAVARGETVLDASVTGELLHRLDDAPRAVSEADWAAYGPLTARQQEVAELVAEGLTNAEIAARLKVTRPTVKGHITVALRRLGLRDRTQLAIHVHRSARPDDGQGLSPLRK